MRFGQSILLLSIGLGTSFSCDREPAPQTAAKPQAPAETPQPATQPVVQDAPTRPAIVMVIDGEQKQFPATRLVVEDRNGKTVALLMSDDPPQAINDDYAGNSYYLEMEFDDLLPTVRGQVWTFEAPSADKLDSPNGIFLEGNRKQLQPFQVKVQFQQIEGEDVVWISGSFYMFTSGRDPIPARLVSVAGRLPVTLH